MGDDNMSNVLIAIIISEMVLTFGWGVINWKDLNKNMTVECNK